MVPTVFILSLLQITLSLSLSIVRGKSAITAFFKEALLVLRLFPLNKPTSQFFNECLGIIFLFLVKSCWRRSHDTCTDSRDRHLKPIVENHKKIFYLKAFLGIEKKFYSEFIWNGIISSPITFALKAVAHGVSRYH